jgi:hypothetical protein
MEIDIVDDFGDYVCDVEVSPSDTIWTLKCKLHREYLRECPDREGKLHKYVVRERPDREGKLYRYVLRTRSERNRTLLKYNLRGRAKSDAIPPPDDQTLFLLPLGGELSQCDKTMESYDIHEGSIVRCVPKWSQYPQENIFRKVLNVFRKVERSSLSLNDDKINWRVIVGLKHACCHMHEVRVLRLSSTGAFIAPYSSHLQSPPPLYYFHIDIDM